MRPRPTVMGVSLSLPGNIRELQNIAERAVILCAGNTLTIDEAWLSGRAPESEVLPEALRGQEKALIEAALARSNGKVAGAVAARHSWALRHRRSNRSSASSRSRKV